MTSVGLTGLPRRRGATTPLWQRSLVYGVLWGVAITAGEALSLPRVHESLFAHAVALGMLLPAWCVTGVAIAWVAFKSEHSRMSVSATAIALALLAIGLSAASTGSWWVVFKLHLAGAEPLAHASMPPGWSNFLYVLWMTLFHGALFTAGCVLAMRTERTRLLLGEAQIARGRSEALLADAQYEALSARLNPGFLLRAMAEVRRRYTQDAAGADALLDQLVGFLRNAMPGMRGVTSTLAAELKLADDYARLQEQIDPQRGRWQFLVAHVPPDIGFPPLLLLPLLDQLTLREHRSQGGELSLSATAERLSLTICSGDAQARIPDALANRVRAALRALYGASCSLWIACESMPEASGPAFQLGIGMPVVALPASPIQSSIPTREVHHE